MGMRKIRQIMAAFAAEGKENTPVMVIQNGSLPNERTVLGTVQDISDRVESEGIGSPGIIVVGEVVHLHPSLALKTLAQNKSSQ